MQLVIIAMTYKDSTRCDSRKQIFYVETDEALADCGAHRGRELLAIILVDRIADTAVDLF